MSSIVGEDATTETVAAEFPHFASTSIRIRTKSGAIRTLAEANRVIWVLKSLLRRKPSEPNDGAETLKRAG